MLTPTIIAFPNSQTQDSSPSLQPTTRAIAPLCSDVRVSSFIQSVHAACWGVAVWSLLGLCGTADPAWASGEERIFVVERGRGKVAVLDGNQRIKEIDKLGRLHHATLKFFGRWAYLISRDGILSQIDPVTAQVHKQTKVGQSSIGLEFVGSWIAVANYAPKDVAILDHNLKLLKRIPTGSRNVGIKSKGSLLVFSLMDLDQIWVLDASRSFAVVQKVAPAGKMPFDALIAGDVYLCAFYKERSIGLLDLKKRLFQKRPLPKGPQEGLSKIPHFGMWGVHGGLAYIPAVGQRKLLIMQPQTFRTVGNIPLPGLPVFAVMSPNARWIAVNYSKDRQGMLSIVHRKSRKVRHLSIGSRVMHMRFSNDNRRLYVSAYFKHQVQVYDTQTWKLLRAIVVPTPSGIFLAPPQGTRTAANHRPVPSTPVP